MVLEQPQDLRTSLLLPLPGGFDRLTRKQFQWVRQIELGHLGFVIVRNKTLSQCGSRSAEHYGRQQDHRDSKEPQREPVHENLRKRGQQNGLDYVV